MINMYKIDVYCDTTDEVANRLKAKIRSYGQTICEFSVK